MTDLEETLRPFVTLPSRAIYLGLERVERLLAALGNPHARLPPIIHVAGTNGKGSTVAFMRAMFEAAGLHAHVFTSPHLVRFNERIRLAGALVEDETLITVVDEIARVNAGEPITFFEMITVAAFVLFARVPADVLLLEVGLGGRLDATNVVTPAVSVITRISMDHTEFLGDTIEQIAAEKAGIMKPGVPCVAGYQADERVKNVLRARAAEVGCPLIEYGRDFETEELEDGFIYQVDEQTSRRADETKFPLPALLGAHQILNAAAAIAAVKIFTRLLVYSSARLLDEHIAAGLQTVTWPGRLQRITHGALAEKLPPRLVPDQWSGTAGGAELWYDGAHNDSGAEALAEQCRRWRAADGAREIHLFFAMQRHKDAAAFLAALAPYISSLTVLPVPDHDSWTADELMELFLTRRFSLPLVGRRKFSSCGSSAENLGGGSIKTLPHQKIVRYAPIFLPPLKGEAIPSQSFIKSAGWQTLTLRPGINLVTGSLYLAGEIHE